MVPGIMEGAMATMMAKEEKATKTMGVKRITEEKRKTKEKEGVKDSRLSKIQRLLQILFAITRNSTCIT